MSTINTDLANVSQPQPEAAISKKAMRQLFSLKYTSKESFNLNLVLQIVHIAKCDDSTTSTPNANKQIYTATLSDLTHKYNGFVFIKESESIHLQESYLINILQVSPIICANQASRVFVVKKYEFLDIKLPLIDAKLIKDDKGKVIFDDDDDKGESILGQDIIDPISNEMSLYTPLKQLSTFSKEFRLFVGIISKTERKFYNSNQGNPGSLFSFIIIDEKGTEMEVTCFNQLVDKFFDKVKVNHTYEITDGSVRRAQKNYNTYLHTDYKIVLENNSTVIEKEDELKLIKLPSAKNNLISTIPSLPLHSLVNVLCIVLEEGEKIMKKTKSGDRPMRIISVGDSSKHKIELTLWGAYANQSFIRGHILQLNSVKIGDFNGRNISSVNESHIAINPSTLEATELRTVLSNYNDVVFKELSTESNSKSIMKELNEVSSSSEPLKVNFINEVLESIDEVVDTSSLTRIKGTITRIVHNDKNFYPGCPEKSCKKKMIQNYNDWSCLVCDKKYPKPTFYFTLSLRIKDCSCEHWIDIFDKTAENLLKITAEEYKNALYDRESPRLKNISNEIEFKSYIFLVKPKITMFNSMTKKKLQVYRIDLVNERVDAKRLIVDIKNALKI